MLYLDRLKDLDYYLSPDNFRFWYLYLVLFIALIIAGIVFRVVLKRHPDYEAFASLEKQVFWAYLAFGSLGLFSVFVRYEKIPNFGNRLFTFLVIVLFLAFNGWLVYYFLKRTKDEVERFKTRKRKEKWLKKK